MGVLVLDVHFSSLEDKEACCCKWTLLCYHFYLLILSQASVLCPTFLFSLPLLSLSDAQPKLQRESFLIFGFLCDSQSSFSSVFPFHAHLFTHFFFFSSLPLCFPLPTFPPMKALLVFLLCRCFFDLFFVFCLFSFIIRLDNSSCSSTSFKTWVLLFSQTLAFWNIGHSLKPSNALLLQGGYDTS